MMHDNLDPHVEAPKPDTAARGDEATDREVPIAAAHTPAIIHAWLDGEAVDESALHAAGGYELWSRVKAESERRRRMQTPTPVSGAIMAAIRKEA
jgi:hypothetical protein